MSSSRVQCSLTGVPRRRLGDGDRLDDIVRAGVGAPAEAAAGVQRVDLHLLRLEPGDCAAFALVDGLELVVPPRSRSRRR